MPKVVIAQWLRNGRQGCYCHGMTQKRTANISARSTVRDPEGNIRSAFTHTENRCDTCQDASGRDAHYPGNAVILCSRCIRDFDKMAGMTDD